MFPLSVWGRVVLSPHKVVVPLLVAHSHPPTPLAIHQPAMHPHHHPHILQSQQPFTNRHLPRHMDGEGDAAALEHTDKEAEAGVVCMWGVVVLVRVAILVRPWGLYLWVAL